MKYLDIKSLAKELSVRVNDLLALNPSNDPFYVGRPSQKQQALWFKHLWDTFGYTNGVHLRRVHYQLVSQHNPTRADGHRYENTDGCWNYLCAASKYARALGFISPTSLEDHRNPSPKVWGMAEPQPSPGLTLGEESFGSPSVELFVPELSFPTPRLAEVEIESFDGYHLEIWCEKSTMNDVLIPLCQEFRANLVTSLGFQSITSAVELLARIAQRGKPARIFYISDFDPAGSLMPTATSRQVEFWNEQRGMKLDIKVEHLALTAEQVRAHNLPRIPIKESDRRKETFEARSGTGAVELDALEALYPGELEKLVRQRLELYRDGDHEAAILNTLAENQIGVEEQWQAITADERTEFAEVESHIDQVVTRYRQEVQELAQRMAVEIEPYDKRLQELWQAIRAKLKGFEATVNPMPEHPPVAEPWHWLLDTRRDYISQIQAYRHRGEN